MKTHLLFSIVLMLFISCDEPKECNGCLAFDNYNIIDLENDRLLESHTVILKKDKILDVLSSRDFNERYKIPDSSIFEGEGDYLMPSLNDMHVHLAPANLQHKKYLKDFLAYGITGLRVMAGNEALLDYRDSIKAGHFPGPELKVAGPIIDGENPMWGNQHDGPKVGSDANVDSIIKSHKEKGYDLIKLYERLPEEKFYELIAAAEKHNMRIAAHLPFKALPDASIDSLFQSSNQSYEHFKNMGALVARNSIENIEQPKDNKYYGYDLAREIDEEKLSSLVKKIKKEKVWMVPTTALWCNRDSLKYEALVESEEFRRLGSGLKNWWKAMGTASDMELGVCDFNRQVLEEMVMQNVPLLAGTDFPNPMLIPGLSLHQELQYMVDAGYSNLEALRSASLYPAHYWNDEKSGVIEQGSTANFVIMEKNPLEEISNTLSVYFTVHNGRIYKKVDLLK